MPKFRTQKIYDGYWYRISAGTGNFSYFWWYQNPYRKNLVPEKILGTSIGKNWYWKSLGIGIGKLWYQKKSIGIGIRLFGTKKVSVLVLFKILGTVTLWSASIAFATSNAFYMQIPLLFLPKHSNLTNKTLM